jgi:hypothetical protein
VKRGGLKIEGGHLGIGHLDAFRVGAAVEAALDGEAGAGGGAGDQLDDHLVGQQRLAAPVLGDEGEQPMLDPVPPDAVVRAQALSPLTRLFLAWGVTLNVASSPQPRASPLPLANAVSVIAERHDLSDLIWLRERGGQQLARLWDGQEARIFSVTSEGLQPASRNFARLVHEGNFLGAWSGLLNILISMALVTLLTTGLWMFGGREVRTYAKRRQRAHSLAG